MKRVQKLSKDDKAAVERGELHIGISTGDSWITLRSTEEIRQREADDKARYEREQAEYNAGILWRWGNAIHQHGDTVVIEADGDSYYNIYVNADEFEQMCRAYIEHRGNW